MTTTRPARKRGSRAEVPITREAIVDAAFRMIDERGSEGFSMRSLATELGVYPATLYWHVGDRARVLGLVEQRWLESIEQPDDNIDWRVWMRELGRSYRANAQRHPNVARIISIERARNTDAMVIPDAVLGRLAGLGLTGDMLVHTYNAVVGAVQGFVVMELARIAEPDADSARDTEHELRSLDPERFPNITANFDVVADRVLSVRWSDGAQSPLDGSFEQLLTMLIGGVEVLVSPLQ
jgi:TetR/AcrR family tetracycline transcriptional repressor